MNREHMPAAAKIIMELINRRAAKNSGVEKAAQDDFAKLEHSLAHKKGITDPKALAAEIGRKKLGEAEMARRSAAGRK